MAGQKFLKGLLYKKTFDSNGNLVTKKPFLLKTLASLVFTSKGKNVDETLEEESHRSACKEYPSFDAYMADLNDGKVSSDEIVYITDAH